MKELERGFQQAVIDLAHAYHWSVFHARTSRTSSGAYVTAVSGDGVGFVDLVLVRDRVLFRELKTDTGRLSPAQRAWGERLTAAGADYAIWKPCDWTAIVKELTRKVA